LQENTVSDKQRTATVEPALPDVNRDQQVKRQPPYHVILWDDDDHSYEYVIKMLKSLFGHPYEHGYELAAQVDRNGRTICLTTTLEHAEFKRDQIHAFGGDKLIQHCKGSMSASIEPDH
jgi:ATP-dependent Clp protease adaptor protein ClpS